MAKIDTSSIPGYDEMTAEDKLKALEAFEYDDHADELERQKNAVSKANSEAAAWKKKHNALLDEDEKKKQEQADNLANMQRELDELRKDKTVSEYKSKFLAQGYDEALAADSARAMVEGEIDTVFANMSKYLEIYRKKVKAEVLKDTPKPPAGGGSGGMTLEKLKTLSDAEYSRFAMEHPEEYKALYEKGD